MNDIVAPAAPQSDSELLLRSDDSGVATLTLNRPRQYNALSAALLDALPRMMSDTVRRALRTFPAILVTGARQSGKTTFLRQEFVDSHRYISLERPDVRARASTDPVGFFEENPPPVILDEIQYAPTLLHYVKDRIDADRRPGQWLLTGSQSFEIMSGVSQSLAGRIAVLRLEPLSVSETRNCPAVSIERLLQRVLGTGPSSRQPALTSGSSVDIAGCCAAAFQSPDCTGASIGCCGFRAMSPRIWSATFAISPKSGT